MRTNKRSIEVEILEALKYYQWKTSSPMLHFAMHIKRSEGYVRKQIKRLVADQKVVQIRGNWTSGKAYFTYKLAENKDD